MFANTLWVTVSNLVANGATFLLMALAAKILSVSDFATLSLEVSMSLFFVTVFDFGVNLTTVRSFGVSQNSGLIDGAMTIKWLTFVLVIAFGVGLLACGSSVLAYMDAIAWSLIGAAVLNLWMGCRTIEQARNSFKSYAVNNCFYACIRFLLGVLALWFGVNGQYFFVAVFVLPGFLFVAAHGILSNSYRVSLRSCSYFLKDGKRYSAWVFISSVCYNGVMYLPQYVVAHRLSSVEVSTYGIVFSFMGMASLIATSVRTVLLPRMISDIDGGKGRVLSRNLLRMLPYYLGLSLAILVAGSYALNMFYGYKMPGVGLVFVICSIGLLVTVYAGFFNVMIHAIGRPKLEALVNFLRLATLLILLWLFGDGLYGIALIFSVVLAVGELAMVVLIKNSGR